MLSLKLRRVIIIAWPKVLDKVRGLADAGVPKAKWNAVTGPIAAVIATLLDAKWVPLHPAEWVDPEGQTWEIDDDVPHCIDSFATYFFNRPFKK